MTSNMHLQLVAILLRRGIALDHLSSVLTLLALLIGLAPILAIAIEPLALVTAILVVLLGLAEKYWAQRVAIDIELFNVLASQAHDYDTKVSDLDKALNELGLAPAPTIPRSLSERSRGALRLLRWQAIYLGAQCLLTLAACITATVLALYA